jgi:hypothetical protein
MTIQYSFYNTVDDLNFEDELKTKVNGYYKNHKEEIDKLSLEAYNGNVPNFQICSRKPFRRLVILIRVVTDLYQEFIDRNIPREIYLNTISDIKLRQNIYIEKTGNYGLSKEDVIWFRHLVAFKIFKIGSLQYQIFNMIYLDHTIIDGGYMKFSNKVKSDIPSGAEVLNVHIPAKADLSNEAVKYSIKKAKEFFNLYFPEFKPKAFICYAWLLYSGNKHVLDESSNIIKFAENFTIISEVNDNSSAIDYIFGKKYKSKSDYPQKTNLQRRALLNLDCLGYSCGIIEFLVQGQDF